ncbi:hypothetical protein QVD99_004806 [Batrachochytrium dendrobatidis]|nr:hypothetical protein QVD99_004806 [Batrachochytrium dendrobatidis]
MCGRKYNKVCPPGSCCSRDGQCGTRSAHCGIGCQGMFGICKPPITKLPPPGPAHPSHENHDDRYTRCKQPGQIALAFEGGTDGDNVPKILDTLQELGVQATFFVNGFNANNLHDADAQAILRRIHDNGHQVGSGTLGHSKPNHLSPEQIAFEMLNNDWMIQEELGISPLYMRIPHGSYTSALIKQLIDMGYVVISHNVDSSDWAVAESSDPATKAIEEFDRSVSHHSGASPETHSFITLHHEWVENGHIGVRAIVEKYHNFGYKFVTVGECLGYPYAKDWYRIRDFNELA